MNYKNYTNEIKNVFKEDKTNENKNLKLSPPWNTFFSEIDKLFGDDPEIKIVIPHEKDSTGCPYMEMYIDSNEKYEALKKILPEEKAFGNIKAKIIMKPSNKNQTTADLFNTAFKGNPAFVDIVDTTVTLFPRIYVVFKNKVVQFYDDNMADPHGMKSTLYQDIAAEVFGNAEGVSFCTEMEE